MIRLYLWFCRVLFCCTRTAGAVGTRLSLRPLIFRRRKFTINLAQTRGEIAELCSPSLRGARATKQSILSSAWLVWIASRALAMTRIGHAAYSGGRVGKGALAPCPPSIGSLILNGGHASTFALPPSRFELRRTGRATPVLLSTRRTCEIARPCLRMKATQTHASWIAWRRACS
jgi:hypothetical protein